MTDNFPTPKKALVVLLLIDTGVGALHLLLSSHSKMGWFFNLTYEENLPTLYSSFQFLLVAGAATFCYLEDKTADSKKVWGWLVVGFCMLGLAIDESFQIHEILIDQIMSGQGGDNLRYFFGVSRETDSLLWTVVFAPVLILAGTGLLVFYYSRLRSNGSLFPFSFLPLGLLLLSAGLEFVEAKILSTLTEGSMDYYQNLSFIEEMAELVSATLFVWIHYQYGMWRRSQNRPSNGKDS